MNYTKCKTSLPKNCKILNEDELAKIVGGLGVEAIVGIITAGGTFTYGAGVAAGKKAYHSGLRNAEWQQKKGQVRSALIQYLVFMTTHAGFTGGPGALVGMLAAGATVYGIAEVALTGFENGFYECVRNWG